MRLEPGPDETLDRLVGSWRIFQLKRGHRFSTDDLVCAWRASTWNPRPRRILDLGCGIGSVGLSVLHRAGPDARLVGVEAQAVSHGLMRRTVARNGLEQRVRVIHGDLRDPEVLAGEPPFDLVTGSPPYIPEGRGVRSPVPQRAYARIELRGAVFDYCRAARRHLAPGGAFTFVMAAADPRTERAPREAGLEVVERWDYVFAPGREPLIATLVCMRAEDDPPPRRTGRLVIRGEDGAWTDAYLAFRRAMGSPVSRPARG